MSEGNGTIQATPTNRLPTDEVAFHQSVRESILALYDREPKKIAIIGKAPSSVHLAPYDDHEWDIWILNTLGFNKEVPRWDVQFELHDLELTKEPGYGGYYDWLKVQDRPVWLRDGCAEFANGNKYPYDRVYEHFADHRGCKYLTNSISLMIAFAIISDVTELGIYGVDMAQHGIGFRSEYAKQRPSCEYWIGVAEGRGIKVSIPEESDLLTTQCVYGFHTTDRWKRFEARKKELADRIAAAQKREEDAHNEAVFLSGALESSNFHSQEFGG